METKSAKAWAQTLHEARIHSEPIAQLTQQLGPLKHQLTRPLAYEIQFLQRGLREAAGEKTVGFKMGLTSEAKRRQMNLDSPLYGVLTDRMQVTPGQAFHLKGLIHSKVEPEIAFVTKKDLSGIISREEALAACGGVCAALEILDSRYEQFKYFSMEDVIADNSSSSHFVLGPWLQDFSKMDLLNLPMKMFVNDRLAQQGVSKDISGDPVVSIVQLCELLAASNQILPAGSIVLAGAATVAEELQPGMQISLTVDGLPPVQFQVAGT